VAAPSAREAAAGRLRRACRRAAAAASPPRDAAADRQRAVDGEGRQTPGGVTGWIRVGFTDARVGAALVQTRWKASASGETQQLWRTTNGGAAWHALAFR
jgi:hypothetical protein